jgi:hypothetical protein
MNVLCNVSFTDPYGVMNLKDSEKCTTRQGNSNVLTILSITLG